jgi:type IX secretion system PorP/SprF family membrane protein
MNKLKLMKLLLVLSLVAVGAYGQDPSFSQFFSSPLNINPALTGITNYDYRGIANIRVEWVNPANPYNTSTASWDGKIFQDKIPENSIFGLGGMIMYDQAMLGTLKSTYASLDASYNIKIAEQGGDQRLGMGVGLTYGHKRVDFSQLSFSQQFTGNGFDTNLPTGEAAFTNMTDYLSVSAGLLYSFSSRYASLDFGAAAFHLNKPKQTVVNDPNQYLAPRYVVHADYENYLNSKVVLFTNSIYQTQAKANYFSVGGGFGYLLSDEGEEDMIFNAGLWYWSNNAIVPYIGFVFNKLQLGLSYDITISQLSSAARRPQTFELSITFRGGDRADGVIPSPWK